MAQLPLISWLVLAVLGYVLATCVLTTLTATARYEIDRHNLIRTARRRRKEYQQRLRERGQQLS